LFGGPMWSQTKEIQEDSIGGHIPWAWKARSAEIDRALSEFVDLSHLRGKQITQQAFLNLLAKHLQQATKKRVTISVDQTLLADQTGVAILVDRRIRDKAETPVTARFNYAKLETAVLLLTDMADLTYVIVDNVIYVTSPKNAAKMRRERTKP